MSALLAHHQRYGDAVRQMGQKSHRFVVLFDGQFAYMLEAQLSAQILAQFDCLLRVFLGGNDDVIRALENLRFRVLYARTFSSRHGMRGNKLHVLAQRVLHVAHDTAFYARNVGYNRARFQAVLIFFNPFDKRMRIKRKHDYIEFSYVVFVDARLSACDISLAQSKVDSFLFLVDSPHFIALFRKSFGIASADKTEPDYENFHILIQLHISLRVCLWYQRNSGSFFSPLPRRLYIRPSCSKARCTP